MAEAIADCGRVGSSFHRRWRTFTVSTLLRESYLGNSAGREVEAVLFVRSLGFNT